MHNISVSLLLWGQWHMQKCVIIYLNHIRPISFAMSQPILNIYLKSFVMSEGRKFFPIWYLKKEVSLEAKTWRKTSNREPFQYPLAVENMLKMFEMLKPKYMLDIFHISQSNLHQCSWVPADFCKHKKTLVFGQKLGLELIIKHQFYRSDYFYRYRFTLLQIQIRVLSDILVLGFIVK